MKRVFVLLASFLITLTLVAGCTGSSSGVRGPITVGSKIDTEGALLSQIIILMLRDNGFEVVDKSGTGQTPIVRKAIISGEIDIYPEYTGNGALFFDETDSDIWKDADKGYQRVKQLDKEANNIIWLTPAPANNTWAIAIPQKLAEEENILTLSDFASYINRGGYVKLKGSEEFATSPMALPAFQEAYGFTLEPGQLVTVSRWRYNTK